jgi:hypothetical protein
MKSYVRRDCLVPGCSGCTVASGRLIVAHMLLRCPIVVAAAAAAAAVAVAV